MRKIIFVFFLLTSIFLSGCYDPRAPKLETCWSPETKLSAQGLITSQAKKLLIESLKASWPRNFTDEDEKRIANALSLKISDFYAISANSESKSFECGANVTAIFTSPDKSKIFSAESIQTFEIFSGENGSMYTVHAVPAVISLMQDIK